MRKSELQDVGVKSRAVECPLEDISDWIGSEQWKDGIEREQWKDGREREEWEGSGNANRVRSAR